MRKNIELEKEVIDGKGKGSCAGLKGEVEQEMLEGNSDDSSEGDLECAMNCCECKNRCKRHEA